MIAKFVFENLNILAGKDQEEISEEILSNFYILSPESAQEIIDEYPEDIIMEIDQELNTSIEMANGEVEEEIIEHLHKGVQIGVFMVFTEDLDVDTAAIVQDDAHMALVEKGWERISEFSDEDLIHDLYIKPQQ